MAESPNFWSEAMNSSHKLLVSCFPGDFMSPLMYSINSSSA